MHTDYPWGESVSLEVRAAPEDEWELSLRLPAWCLQPTISLNGVAVDTDPRNGYTTLTRRWVAGDLVVLTLPMPAQLVAGHPLIESTRSSAAIMRGPIVYCLEQCDQPPRAADMMLTVDANADLRSVWRADLLGGCMAVVASGHAHPAPGGNALYRRRDEVTSESQQIDLTAVPYFLWGNRAAGAMNVWIPVESQ
jgi:DUF1680 family protein